MSRYREAGVDIDAAGALVKRIAAMARSTFRPEVLSEIGGFAGQFRVPTGYRDPVLVASTDGVGTKVKIAQRLGIHHTIGVDLVAMCVNDIAVQGAEPLFFLDYLAAGKLDPGVAEELVGGIVGGCRQAGCALLGGETAEMPGVYPEGEYDLAGFVVGIMEKGGSIDGSLIRAGDSVLGIASNGLHSNGYSLVRRVLLEEARLSLDAVVPPLGRSLGEELLEPTRIYSAVIRQLSARSWPVRGAVHVTGGGIVENVPRVLPPGLGVAIDPGNWKVPAIFSLVQELGNISPREMFRTFNMGIGLILIVAAEHGKAVRMWLEEQGEAVFSLGEVILLSEAEAHRVKIKGIV